MESLQGPDPTGWQWGKLQFGYFVHPMTPILDQAARAAVNVGLLPRGGGAYTVNVSNHHPDSCWQAHARSFRTVLDVGNWKTRVPSIRRASPATRAAHITVASRSPGPRAGISRCCTCGRRCEGGEPGHRAGAGASMARACKQARALL